VVSAIALTSTDDVMVGGVDAVTNASGTLINSNVLLRLDSANFLTRKWGATYPVGASAVQIFPRTPRGDYITVGFVPDEFHGITGQVVQVLENATTATTLGQYIDQAAALGSDKTTLWMSGGVAGQTGLIGPTLLNPWSTTTTNLLAGQSFIIGARDNGTSVGPWFTTNAAARPASLFKILVDASGDLIVLAVGGGRGDTGAVSLNGREILSLQDGASVFKVAAATGTVVWKTGLTAAAFPLLAIAPDGATVAVSSQTSTYGLTMYSGADGTIPASFTGSGLAQAVVSGGNSLYVVGVVTGSADFNPGSRSDIQGNLPGVFVTRFSY
jgi:hypothetical protein